ncbi:aspartyl-phosphate phosphatase Spo0E family protein [Clostridium sp. CX1]|uniref:Aspartyl-phosphate phosphatase Spo0E family protein n=1 Tax=Clostridium tanneri TaxID=3037988 RepID=A0ABU4JQH5_9CLOT|nr:MULTISPECIES: aspartyl-phosphate phosphatase Spo0E family protein [unclassified Clostridium]MCT8977642.1 aspartyl-phosphate phosphatase Spo0E family protein [Clostridium sp. CX1]MDW8800395.1 aspartyl-phosphate phosphatase Spo0E family protein [Clostridium sp. A1-XYC3]
MDIKILDKEIDNLKELLYRLLDSNSLTNENVVNYSQKLDKLIVEYQKHRDFVKVQ